MKELNRRAFLKLSGASAALLALAACGGGSSAPAAPATPKDAKVLEALNLYRGKLPPLTLDSGLDKAAEEVAKIAKGEMEYKPENMKALSAAYTDYPSLCKPIGVRMDVDDESMHVTPVCVYSDNAEEMARNLDNQLDEGDKANLKSPAIKLVNIKTFEHNGVTYWVALIAESKVTA